MVNLTVSCFLHLGPFFSLKNSWSIDLSMSVLLLLLLLLCCTCFVVVQVTVDLMHKADEYFQNQGGTKVRPTATSAPSNCKKPVMTYGLISSVVALIYKIDGVIERVAKQHNSIWWWWASSICSNKDIDFLSLRQIPWLNCSRLALGGVQMLSLQIT